MSLLKSFLLILAIVVFVASIVFFIYFIGFKILIWAIAEIARAIKTA